MSGLALTPKQAERVGRAVALAESGGRGPPAIGWSAASAHAEVAFCRATTGTADANGNYSAQLVVYDAATRSWSDVQAVKLRPLNGEGLTSGSRYAARPAGFDGADELFLLCDTPASGGTEVTVRESDGSPSGLASFIQTSQSTGLRVTDVSGSVATLANDPADLSLWGVVTTAAQSFNGLKFFDDGLVCSPAADAIAIRLQVAGTGTANTTTFGGLRWNNTGALVYLALGSAWDASHNVGAYLEANASLQAVTFTALDSGTVVRPDLRVVIAGSVTKTGETGTYAGMEFTSGLLTGGVVGASGTISYRKAGGTSDGTITVSGGLITGWT